MAQKRILFIAPKFYNYEQLILSEIEKQGFVTDAVFYEFNDVIGGSDSSKNKLIDYQSSLKNFTTRFKYDYLFVIKGNILNFDFLDNFINKNPRANKIIYHWDSIKNSRLELELFSMFDKVYSFDLTDIENYPEHNLIHKPLFYIDSYNKNVRVEAKFDIATIGRIDLPRLNYIHAIKTHFPNYRYKILLKAEFNLSFFVRLLIRGYKKYKQNFTFKTIPTEQSAEIINYSKAILDIPHPQQSGLTIRTFEALALHKKLITSNNLVSKYDFYHPNNIFILNKENIRDIDTFMNAEFFKIDESILKKYALKNWIHSFFSDYPTEYLSKSN